MLRVSGSVSRGVRPLMSMRPSASAHVCMGVHVRGLATKRGRPAGQKKEAQGTDAATDAAIQASIAASGDVYLPSHLPKALLRMNDTFLVEKGKGSYLYGTNGKAYLDFTCGIAVTSLGHCHPHVVRAIKKQAELLLHGQMNCIAHKPAFEFINRLKKHMPAGLDSFTFSNAGAEAVENAIKLARHATGRQNVVVFQGGFHGRTLGAGSLTTAKTFYRAGFQPMMPGVFVAPFPYCHHCPVKCNGGTKGNVCCNYTHDALDQLFKQQTAPGETAAILFEPVLGEGGYVPATKEFVQYLRKKADETGALLIADEVQTGYGRTGKMWAMEHYDVVPDIMVVAKGIASGLPLSLIATRKELMDKAQPGSLGGTYGGNVLACSAALAVLDVFEQRNILDNVNARGTQLRNVLRRLKKKYPHFISDIRGLGLMQGIEFKNVPYGTAGKITKAATEEGLLLLTASIYETIRIIPPLTVRSGEIQKFEQLFDKAIEKVVSTLPPPPEAQAEAQDETKA